MTHQESVGTVCPKCQYERNSNDDPSIPDAICPSCGIVYQKFLKNQKPELENSTNDVLESLQPAHEISSDQETTQSTTELESNANDTLGNIPSNDNSTDDAATEPKQALTDLKTLLISSLIASSVLTLLALIFASPSITGLIGTMVVSFILFVIITH